MHVQERRQEQEVYQALAAVALTTVGAVGAAVAVIIKVVLQQAKPAIVKVM